MIFGIITATKKIVFSSIQGFAQQYLFLVTFALMTAMSTEIWMQLR
jgi:hypothetical protein